MIDMTVLVDGFLKRTIICIDKEFPSYCEQNSHIN